MGRINLNEEIIKAIRERLEHGKKEYPEELDINDGRDRVQESLEEALDLAVYITAKLLQIQKDKEDA